MNIIALENLRSRLRKTIERQEATLRKTNEEYEWLEQLIEQKVTPDKK